MVIELGATRTNAITEDVTRYQNFGFEYKELSNDSSYLISTSLLTEDYQVQMGWSSSIKYSYAKRSSDRKTVYWYSTQNAGSQCNSNNETYWWLVIGFV